MMEKFQEGRQHQKVCADIFATVLKCKKMWRRKVHAVGNKIESNLLFWLIVRQYNIAVVYQESGHISGKGARPQ